MDVTQTQQERTPTELAFHASRIIIAVGFLIAFAALSFPFVEVGDTTRNAVRADALPAVLLLAPVFAVTLLPDRSRPLPSVIGWVALTLGLSAFPFAIVKFVDATTLAETLDGTVGLGPRLLVFGTLVVIVGIAVGLARNLMGRPTSGPFTRTASRAGRTG